MTISNMEKGRRNGHEAGWNEATATIRTVINAECECTLVGDKLGGGKSLECKACRVWRRFLALKNETPIGERSS